jgi:hypothetical protein
MPEKSNGDYYYVESETINDLLDGFQIYDDGSGNIVFHDTANDDEYVITAGSGFDAPAGTGYSVDGSQVVGAAETLDDSSGGATDADLEAVGDTSTDSSTAINNNFAEIYAVLLAHGLVEASA